MSTFLVTSRHTQSPHLQLNPFSENTSVWVWAAADFQGEGRKKSHFSRSVTAAAGSLLWMERGREREREKRSNAQIQSPITQDL